MKATESLNPALLWERTKERINRTRDKLPKPAARTPEQIETARRAVIQGEVNKWADFEILSTIVRVAGVGETLDEYLKRNLERQGREIHLCGIRDVDLQRAKFNQDLAKRFATERALEQMEIDPIFAKCRALDTRFEELALAMEAGIDRYAPGLVAHRVAQMRQEDTFMRSLVDGRTGIDGEIQRDARPAFKDSLNIRAMPVPTDAALLFLRTECGCPDAPSRGQAERPPAGSLYWDRNTGAGLFLVDTEASPL